MATSIKTEARAILKIEDLIAKKENMNSDFKKNDTRISWDGVIDLYKNNVNKKENFEHSIDVQIKGRTTHNKKLKDKSNFSIDRTDLENYYKKDGTIFILCLFKENSDEYRIYYNSLQKSDISKLLKAYGNNASKIKIPTLVIKNENHFEEICRNFVCNRDIQKKIDNDFFNQNNLTLKNGNTIGFTIWSENLNSINPEDFIETEQYFYEYN